MPALGKMFHVSILGRSGVAGEMDNAPTGRQDGDPRGVL